MQETNNVIVVEDDAWKKNNPNLAKRGIDESTWNALSASVFPGAKTDSKIMAIDYCKARSMDIMMKPVHIVPMSVKDAKSNEYSYRDVIMPGIGTYRIQAERTRNFAGSDAAEFGPMIDATFRDKNNKEVSVSYPEWCKYTVYKLMDNGTKVSYTALEYWIENYATQSNKVAAPNAMWLKRPRAQLAKCAEAQALRRGWPEIGQDATYEEMEGKDYIDHDDHDDSEKEKELLGSDSLTYSDEQFDKILSIWSEKIKSKGTTAEKILELSKKKNVNLSAKQIKSIKSIKGVEV